MPDRLGRLHADDRTLQWGALANAPRRAECLDRKAERQDLAIEALRRKHGVNVPRPRIVIN